jgi:hypothetical protein
MRTYEFQSPDCPRTKDMGELVVTIAQEQKENLEQKSLT